MNGLREFAHTSGASVDYYPMSASGGWEENWSLLVRVSFLQSTNIYDLTGV